LELIDREKTMFLSILFAADVVKNTIYLYAGEGAGKQSLAHVRYTIDSLLGKKYNVTEIQPEEVTTIDWERNAACFVMPGGADIPYQTRLHPRGNERIKKYVENGGSYLGLCAGGYYGGRKVEFDIGGPLEVNQDRDLQFFPGVVRGPVLAPYDYKTDSGARAAHIQWGKLDNLRLYFNGGGSFVDADRVPGVSVLASYNMVGGTQIPAVIETTTGLGRTVLSGVHFEYDPELMKEGNGLPEDIIPTLKRENPQRVGFLFHVFQRLRLI
jgi:glutamine amidotransferase-like uncharacterized protein